MAEQFAAILLFYEMNRSIVDSQVKKRGYSERSKYKTMASTTVFNQEALQQVVKTVFKDYGETQYTEQLLADVLAHANAASTFTDFFTRLMNDLFKNHGLLLLDATYGPFRQYETQYFEAIIQHNEEIAHKVVAQEAKLAQAGYTMPIGATKQNANLFYVKDGERFLLERKDGHFKNALAHANFTEQQLLELAKSNPQALSNNVVTRPLMQEMTIPVLAFVGGPGELAYWATLKPAFETLQLQMPIFAPRLNITMLSRQVQVLLHQRNITIEQALNNEINQKLKQFIHTIQDEKAQQFIEQMNIQLEAQYEQLAEYLQRENYHLEVLVSKNKDFHERQFRYLQSKIKQKDIEKHETIVRQYQILQAELYPNDGYQERVYNPYQYLNIYGPTLVDDLLSLEMGISNHHNIVLF